MKIDYIKNQIKVAGMVIACTSLCSCNSEIEDGTTDIDSWPLPRIEVTYPTEFEHPGVVFTVEDIERFRKIATQQIQPQYAGYELLRADKLSQSTYIMNGPYDEIYAGYRLPVCRPSWGLPGSAADPVPAAAAAPPGCPAGWAVPPAAGSPGWMWGRHAFACGT